MALYRVLEAFKPRFRVPVLAMPGTSVPGLPRGQGASEPKEGPDDTESIGTKNSSKMELGPRYDRASQAGPQLEKLTFTTSEISTQPFEARSYAATL